MKVEGAFLLIASLGLIPIALSYGLLPNTTLPFLFDINASQINVKHIFRAVMGLYLCLAIFWVIGAYKVKYQLPAIYSLVVFMFGLALGRMLSLVADGIPYWLLIV